MNTIERMDYIARHCEALELVSRWLYGSAEHVPRVAACLCRRAGPR